MADKGPRRRRLTTVVLGTAAPAMLAGGLFLVADAREPAPVPPARSALAPPVPASESPSTSAGVLPGSAATARTAPRRGVVPDVVVVPSLGVRAPVSGIRTEDGALTPPSDPASVGWWTGGARPGSDAGAAVVAGHTVHAGGGAFDDLDRLAPGGQVAVLSGRTRVAYTVESVEVLSRDELARRSARLFDRSGAPRLVLVTCEDWDGTAYLSNVVVIATPRA